MVWWNWWLHRVSSSKWTASSRRFSRVRHRPLRDVSSHVIAAATRFRERDDLTDDLTLFMMRFR